MPEISDEELKKLKDAAAEAAKLKESADKLEAKNKELLTEKQTEKEKREAAEKLAKEKEQEVLKANGNFKELAEKLEAEKVEREKREKEHQEKMAKGAKLTKVQEELSKQGVDAKVISHALRLVNIDEVTYDAGTGIVVGADSVAAKLKLELPHLFVQADREKLPPGGNEGGDPPAEMSDEWFSKLSIADQDKHRAAYYKSKGIDWKPRDA